MVDTASSRDIFESFAPELTVTGFARIYMQKNKDRYRLFSNLIRQVRQLRTAQLPFSKFLKISSQLAGRAFSTRRAMFMGAFSLNPTYRVREL